MSKIDGNSGVTPPRQPTNTNQTEKPVGTLGDKTVAPLSLDENLQQGLQSKVHPDTNLSDRSISYPPLNREALSLLRNLVREKSWEGVREALNQRVKTPEHFEQLAQIAPENLSLEAQQLVINRYADIATEQIVGHLTNLRGSTQEQLDSLNLYFILPDSPHNAIRTVCQSVSNDFMRASQFEPGLEKLLTSQLETRTFGQLQQHLVELDRRVAIEGSPEQIEKNNWQINQRNIEVKQ